MVGTSTGSHRRFDAMAKGRDRPRHQQKRKPKDKAPKIQPASVYEPPMQAEVIKPKRKEREPQDEE
jgi:hypothetical protein